MPEFRQTAIDPMKPSQPEQPTPTETSRKPGSTGLFGKFGFRDFIRNCFNFNRRIVISYRRNDTEHFSGRIYDRLASVYGKMVVRDVNSLEPSDAYREKLNRHIENCRVFLPVIGEKWEGKTSDENRRIDDPEDLVRAEIRWAINRYRSGEEGRNKLKIIPLLVDLKDLPTNIPDDIKYIHELTHIAFLNTPDFEHHAADLMKQIKRSFIGVSRFWALLSLIIITMGSAIFAAKWWENQPFRPSSDTMKSFTKLAGDTIWIAYDPPGHNDRDQRFPSASDILADLRVLHDCGFSGIVTFGSEGTLLRIPELARREGFSGVIMGIADPTSEAEIAQAMKCSTWVDAYCVGHNTLSRRYDKKIYNGDQIIEVIQRVRKATGKPVTTTELVSEMQLYPSVWSACDWLFPDIHAYWHDGAMSPDAAVQKTVDFAKTAMDASYRNSNKPVMLKMISYPSGGADRISQISQSEFYQKLYNRYQNDADAPRGSGHVFFSAFDVEWKTGPEWEPAERYLGLFDKDRNPKPAAEFFRMRIQKRTSGSNHTPSEK